jgi:hypothetical protein
MNLPTHIDKNMTIVIKRPPWHHKGEKELVRIPYGAPIPPGVIVGKGSIITVESSNKEVS